MRALSAWKTGFYLLLIMLVALWLPSVTTASAEPVESSTAPRVAMVLDIQDAIGPATRDFLLRSLDKASQADASLVIVRLDTYGGLDASTRDIVKAMLSSTVPVAIFVAPTGARAASAGTYILYASSVAVMSPATSVGAATPVAIGGASSAPDQPIPQENGQAGRKQHTTQVKEAGDAETHGGEGTDSDVGGNTDAAADDEKDDQNGKQGSVVPSGDAM